MSIAIFCVYRNAVANDFAKPVTYELNGGEHVIGDKQSLARAFSGNGVLRKQGAIAFEDQGDHRVAQPYMGSGSTLSASPCNKVWEGTHNGTLQNVMRPLWVYFALCQVL